MPGAGSILRKPCGPDFPFEEFTECYRGISREILRREGIPVKPGLYELLDCLKEKKIPMAVATSSSARHAGENLREAGVEQYFSCMITGDQVKRSKPDPEIYLLACRKLGVPPEKPWPWRIPPTVCGQRWTPGLWR